MQKLPEQNKSHLLEKIILNIKNYKPKSLILEGLTPSAVLVPILKSSESVIFIKRTTKVKDHKGQIAFPGGVMFDNEKPEITALREAEEEVGINPKDVMIIGSLDDTITIAGYLIHPVVGIVDDKNFIPKPNPDEVEKVIIIKLEDLLSAKYIEGGDLKWEFHIGDVVIWGATARILKNFLEVSFKINYG